MPVQTKKTILDQLLYRWQTSPEVAAYIQREGRYRGADVSRINRWRTRDSNADTPEIQKKLAEKYTEIFSVLVKYKKDVSRVTFWGVYEGASWIGGSPLLFDRKYHPRKLSSLWSRPPRESR